MFGRPDELVVDLLFSTIATAKACSGFPWRRGFMGYESDAKRIASSIEVIIEAYVKRVFE